MAGKRLRARRAPAVPVEVDRAAAPLAQELLKRGVGGVAGTCPGSITAPSTSRSIPKGIPGGTPRFLQEARVPVRRIGRHQAVDDSQVHCTRADERVAEVRHERLELTRVGHEHDLLAGLGGHLADDPFGDGPVVQGELRHRLGGQGCAREGDRDNEGRAHPSSSGG